MIFILTSMMKTIEQWNDKLNLFFDQHGDNAAFGTIALVGLFAIGCWAVSYFSKK